MNIIDNEPLHTFTHIYTFDYEFFWSNIGQIRFSKLGKPYFKPLFSLMTSSSGRGAHHGLPVNQSTA